MVGAGAVKTFEALVDDFDGCGDAFGAQHLHHLAADVLVGEGLVNLAHVVLQFVLGQRALADTQAVDVVDDGPLSPLDEQFNGRAEGYELVHAGHVDAVVVGIAHLGRRADEDNLARMQSVQNTYDALLQRCSAHDAVVDDDQVVLVGHERAVGDVVDVGGKVVALVALGDEGAQLDVLPGHLLRADVHAHDALHLLLGGLVVARQFANLAHLLAVQRLLKAAQHAVVGHFGRVGDEGEDGVGHVAVDGLRDALRQLFAKVLALLVDVEVGTATEIDTFERTRTLLASGQNLRQHHLARGVHHQSLAGFEFLYLVGFKVECRLQDGSLAGQHQYLVVLVPERRPYAPRVAHGEHLARARHSADDETAVPQRCSSAQDVAHVDVFLDEVGDILPRQSTLDGDVEEAFALAVEPVPHLFQQDERVAVDARMLSCGRYRLKHLVDVREVEVATQTQVLGSPVVAAHEGVNEGQRALAGGRIAKVPHVDFTCKGNVLLGKRGVAELLGRKVAKLGVHGRKDFANGTTAHRTLTEHVFRACLGTHFHTRQACTFLAAVVLLLHQQVELVEPIHPRTILLLIVLKRFLQANHRHATLVLQLLHAIPLYVRYSFLQVFLHDFLRPFPQFLALFVMLIFLAKVLHAIRAVEGARLASLVLVEKQAYGGVSTLSRSAYEGTEEDVGQGVEEHLHAYDARRHDARVGSVHRDASLAKPVGQLEGEERDGQFRVAVDVDALETALAPPFEEFGEVESTQTVDTRGHVHDATPLPHQGQEQTREQVGPNVVHAYRALQSVNRYVVARLDGAGIVHQEVKVFETTLHLVGKTTNRRQVGQIKPQDLNVGVTRLLYHLFALRHCQLGAIAGHDGVVTLLGNSLRLFVAHATVSASDYC